MDLLEIKNRIINKVIIITVVFQLPILAFFIAHLIKYNWSNRYLITIIFPVLQTLIFILRRHLSFRFKFHFFSIVLLLLGIVNFYQINFFSAFYYALIPILLSGILLGRNSALIYLFIGLSTYSIIGLLYLKGIIGIHIDYKELIASNFIWINFILQFLFTLFLILIATSELHKYFLDVIEAKNKLTTQLENQKDNLEILVKERTKEVEAANEELLVFNEELNQKNEKIGVQNKQLTHTLNELKKTQANLIQSEKMASLGVLTAGVAHEINNPLNYIIGAYEGIKDLNSEETDLDKNKIAKFLDILNEGVLRAAKIVSSLCQFSSIDEDKLEICGINSILDNCVTILNSKLKDRIKITKNYSTTPIEITGNRSKLHQIFTNLIANAEQAIEVKGEISLNTFIEGNNYVIEIRDTGIGISKDNIDKITDPFYTTKDPGKGTGIGLYIVYNIIKEYKGSITFKSEPNKGTTACVKFPL